MTTKDEVRSTIEALRTERALKLALEVLGLGDDASLAERDQAITAIRSVLNEHGEALVEQPAPVAEPHKQQDHDCALKRGGIVCRHCDLEIVEASYGPQIERQQDIPDLIAGALGVSRGTAYDMMREALVGAQQQEPVAWVETREDGSIYYGVETDTVISDDPSWLERPMPVYTSPPASKPWVGLTSKEREELAAHGIKGDA